jgi:hypothetical protein
MGENKTLVTASIILLIMSSFLGYRLAVSKSESKITQLESVLKEKEIEISKLTPQAEEPDPVSGGGNINCLLCHDLSQTKSFHLPQTIMKIDEKKGKRRRVCIDCHGPNAYDEQENYLGWSSDRQMTPIEMISFDEKAGVNGIFEFPNSVPHTIHKRLMYTLKVITCDDCHLSGGEIVQPTVDAEKGQVLVCQNCKYHPEEGNYIKIHLEDGGKGCATCHTGNMMEIHKEKTFSLGVVG